MSHILALDLGGTMGWAFSDGVCAIQSGSVRFKIKKDESAGVRFLRFQRWLNEVERKGVDDVYYEDVKKHIGVYASHIYGGFLAILMAWCEKQKIPYKGIGVGTIKKHIAKTGRASKTDVIDAVKKIGHEPKDDNEADALALLHFVLDGKN